MGLERERRPMFQAQAMVVAYLGLLLVVSLFLHARPWRAEVGANPHDRYQVWSWRLIESLFLVVLVAVDLGLGLSLLRATIWASAVDNRPSPFWSTGLATAGTTIWVVALVIGSVRRWFLRRTGR
jgi:hypothetical protein